MIICTVPTALNTGDALSAGLKSGDTKWIERTALAVGNKQEENNKNEIKQEEINKMI